MKISILTVVCFLGLAAGARADTTGYAQCGTYDGYLLLYKSTQKLEELGKLRCGEKLEVMGRGDGFAQVRTLDGRVGWVRETDLSDAPPSPQRVFTFGLSEQPKQAQPDPNAEHPNLFLRNEDVLMMHALKHGADFIVEKIRSSRCAFDKSPAAVQRLQSAGLSDKIILAMLEAPNARAAGASGPESVEVKVPDGTAIEVEITGNIFSEELESGAVVKMAAAEDLVVDGVPIVVRGSVAHARVLAFQEHGGSGEVALFMQDIVATNGDTLPLIFAAKQPGKYRPRNFEGYPFFLTSFRKGSPAIQASDTRLRAVVHGDTVLSVPPTLAANLPAREARRRRQRDNSAHPETAPRAEAKPVEAKPVEARPADVNVQPADVPVSEAPPAANLPETETKAQPAAENAGHSDVKRPEAQPPAAPSSESSPSAGSEEKSEQKPSSTPAR